MALSSQTAEYVFPDPFAFGSERWLGNTGREWRIVARAL